MRAAFAMLLFVCSSASVIPTAAWAQDEQAAAGEDAEVADSEPIERAPTDAEPTEAPAPEDTSSAAPSELEEELAPAADADAPDASADEFANLGLDEAESEDSRSVSGALEAPPVRDGVWQLDDDLGPDEPWDDYDPSVSYVPRGNVHGGLALRVAGLIGGSPPAVPGPLGELSGFIDVRFGETNPFHLRIALAIGAQPVGDEFLGAGTSANTSPVSFRLRVLPIALDLENWGAIRLGASLGVQLVENRATSGWESEAFGGVTSEAVLRLLDGHLEVGLFGGLQLTAVAALSRVDFRTGVTTQGVLGATAAVVF